MRRMSWNFCFLFVLFILLWGCSSGQPEVSTPQNTASPVIPSDTPIPPTLDQFSIVLTNNSLTAQVITPLPTNTPAPRSCAEINGPCFVLRFDLDSCSYEGEPVFTNEPVTFLFLNESDLEAAWFILTHSYDRTIQDMIDYFGEGASSLSRPGWAEMLFDWPVVNPGGSHVWNGALDPGIHSIFCAQWTPTLVWFGAGLTVEE